MNKRQHISTIAMCLALLSACNYAPKRATVAEIQALADQACICRETAENPANFDPDAPTACWREFDAALKTTQWAFMSVAADGPVSSAGICVGKDSGSSADSCAPQNIVWYNRSLGACSAAEEADFTKQLESCLAKGGGEIACANGLRAK